MYSADNAHFAVSSLNLACFSDKYRPDGLYAGIIVYGQKSGEPLRFGGRNIYPGYIVMVNTTKVFCVQPELQYMALLSKQLLERPTEPTFSVKVLQ